MMKQFKYYLNIRIDGHPICWSDSESPIPKRDILHLLNASSNRIGRLEKENAELKAKRKMPSDGELRKFCVTYQNADGGDSFFIQDLVEAALKQFGDFE